MATEYTCFRCSSAVELDARKKLGFRESCASCATDLHCCRNCNFFDAKAYNECRETSADRIVDKEKGNRCEYFTFRASGPQSAPGGKTDAKRKLDDLFK